MYKSSIRVCLFIILLIAPSVHYAAGLGNLTLSSALGQPLRAEINLVAVNNNEIPSLKVNLASPEAFAQAGLEYKPFFSTFKVSIEPRANGDPYIRVTSPQLINEPYLSMLVELTWASGRVLREYTVLLDPVSNTVSEPAAPVLRSKQADTQPLAKPLTVEQPIMEYAELPADDQSGHSSDSPAQPVHIDQSGETYTVNQGDTLSAIARQYLPHDADLNQMLVALYRANRDAFIQNNMNLLKVGTVLKVPSSSEVEMVDKAEAGAEIKIQVADWKTYRDKLAAVASGSQTTDIRRQTDEGQISTTVGDKAITAEAAPKEVLRLSSGGEQAVGDDLGENETLARLRMMEEDSIARNLALKEANERVVMLEKNVENLQRLLKLKDSTLAKAQQQAEVVAARDEPVPDTNVDMTALPSDSVTELLKEDSAVIDHNVEMDASLGFDETLNDVVEAPSLPQPQPQPLPQPLPQTVEVSFIDQVVKQAMDHIEYVAGALGVLLLGILALFIKRRRESEDTDDMDDMDFDDLSSPETGSANSIIGDGMERYTLDKDKSEVPESRENQSFDDELTKPDSIEEDDTDFFLDDEVSDTESNTLDESVDLSKAVQQDAMERSSQTDTELDLNDGSDNNDLGNGIDSEVVEDLSESSHEIEFDLSDTDNGSVAQMDDADALSDERLSTDIMDLSDSHEQDTDALAERDAYDFDLDGNDDNVSPLEISDDQFDDVALADDGLADTDSEDTELEQVPPLKLDDIDLNLDDEPESELDFAPEDEVLTDEGAGDQDEGDIALSDKGENWHEVETKIDLAKAYQELDDKEGAREILEEVIRDGDDDQKQRAEFMLGSL